VPRLNVTERIHREDDPSGRGADDQFKRCDWILGSAVAAGLVILLIHLFDFYALPHNDYIQFTKPAEAFLNI